MKSVTLHEAAEAELRAALDYYENQRSGLGRELRLMFEAALRSVRANPCSFPLEEDGGFRFALFRRFPYKLVFLDLEDHLWIVAVAHLRRRPRYWVTRHPM